MFQRNRHPDPGHPHEPGQICPECDIDWGRQRVVKTRSPGAIRIGGQPFTEAVPSAYALKGLHLNDPAHNAATAARKRERAAAARAAARLARATS